jgi:hypothetical protein
VGHFEIENLCSVQAGGNHMSDRRLSRQQARISVANLGEATAARPKRNLLVAFWIFSLILGTTGWWAGLAWAAFWLAQHAIS